MVVYQGSVAERILKMLLYKTLSYKEVERLVRRKPALKKTSSQTVRNTLTRLKKQGLVSHSSGGWSSAKMPQVRLRKAELTLPEKKKRSRQSRGEMVVVYDIPEVYKVKRNWLRSSLVILGFRQLQKSVWVGPAPLPGEFIEQIGRSGMLEYTHFFQVKKRDIV